MLHSVSLSICWGAERGWRGEGAGQAGEGGDNDGEHAENTCFAAFCFFVQHASRGRLISLEQDELSQACMPFVKMQTFGIPAQKEVVSEVP